MRIISTVHVWKFPASKSKVQRQSMYLPPMETVYEMVRFKLMTLCS